MMQPFVLEEFKKEHIPEYLQYAFFSYKASNPYQRNADQQQFNQRTTVLISAFIEAAELTNMKRGTHTHFNLFIRIDGKMAIAAFHCQLHYFMKKIVPNYTGEMQYRVFPARFLQEIAEFSGVVGVRMAIRKQFQGLGLFEYYESEKIKGLLRDGYEYGIGMVFSPIILRRFHRSGAELIRIQSTFNSHPFAFEIVKVSYRKYLAYLNARSSL